LSFLNGGTVGSLGECRGGSRGGTQGIPEHKVCYRVLEGWGTSGTMNPEGDQGEKQRVGKQGGVKGGKSPGVQSMQKEKGKKSEKGVEPDIVGGARIGKKWEIGRSRGMGTLGRGRGDRCKLTTL